MRDLEGVRAVITGAASGIGRGCAVVFAAEGASLALLDINGDGVNRVAADLTAEGATARSYQLDLAHADSVKSTIDDVDATLGGIDVLVNVAGVSDVRDTVVEDLDEEVFDRTINANVKPVVLTCKHVVPVMKRQGSGAIVNVTSIAALVGAGGAAYTAAKGAVAALSRQVAYQSARHGIRCNTIVCGPFDTPMVRSSKTKKGLAGPITSAGELPRYGVPEEAGYLAAFLASSKAAFITGSAYTIDGGRTQR